MRRLIASLGLFALVFPAAAVPQTLSDETQALAAARRQAAVARARAATLEKEAGVAESAAARVRGQAAAIASRVAAAQADIQAAETRIRIVATLRARQRARLAAQQEPIVQLAAGLQTMARRPAALALMQRGSIGDLVHVRAVLASQSPLVRARTEGLRREVAEGISLQRQAEEAVATLREGQRRLEEERIRLAVLERDHGLRAQQLIDSAMIEQDRATALGEEARDIVDMMGRVEARDALAAKLARLPGPRPRPSVPGHSPLPAPGAFGGGGERLPYRLPVSGRLVTGYGEVAESGVRARGLTLTAPQGARVVAPAAGRVAYAGPFRDYGRILIIDHDGGWTSLVTGLAELRAHVGDRLAQGDPIGRLASARKGMTVELRKDGRSVNIAALLAER